MPLVASSAVIVAAAAAIMFLGTRLTRSANLIAAGSKYGRGWVGFLLLAAVTSLPEAITGLSSVTIYAAPNIAVGDIFGSLQFNLLSLAAAAILLRPPPAQEIHWNRIACIVILGLGAIVTLSIVFSSSLALVAGMGLTTPLLLLAHPTLARYQARKKIGIVVGGPPANARTWWTFGLSSVGIVIAALALPPAAKDVADLTGLGRTAIGTLVVAAATSLPELVVTFAALRMGAVDLAVSDIVGSNLFDLFILGLDDFAYPGGPLLGAIDPAHAWSLGAAVVMHLLLLAGLGSPRRLLGGWAWGIAAAYPVAQWLLLKHVMP